MQKQLRDILEPKKVQVTLNGAELKNLVNGLQLLNEMNEQILKTGGRPICKDCHDRLKGVAKKLDSVFQKIIFPETTN